MINTEHDDKKPRKPIILEKGIGLGWTLNFDNKWSYAILVAIIGLVVFVVICSLTQH